MKRSIVVAMWIMFVAVACLAEISGERPVASPAYGPPPGYRYNAASASDGHDFLVVWLDEMRNPAFNVQIYAARVNASGQLLDPLGIRIPTLSANLSQFNVVYLGSSYFVCWNEGSSATSPLMGVRISREGVLLDSIPRVIADHGKVLASGAASNGNRAVVVYTGPTGSLMTVVLDREANVVGGPRLLTSPAGPANEDAVVASNGHGFLVLRTLGNTTTATTLDENGTTQSSLAAFTVTGLWEVVELASDGDGYLAVYGVAGQINARHFGPGGEILETSTIPLQEVFPGFVFTGDSYLLMDGDPVQSTVGFRRLSRAGQPIGGYTPIAKASSFAATATMASNGSSAFEGWVEWGALHQIFNGSVIDPPSLSASKPTVIVRAATTQGAPAAASNGVNTAIVWNEDDGVYAGRLTPDGQLLDGRGVRIAERSITAPRIVFDGANYVIGWIEQQPSAPYTVSVKVARMVPGSGALLDPNGVTVGQNLCGYGLTMTQGANSALVAWSECKNVVANTVSRDLTPGSPVTITPPQTMSSGALSSAWNGSEWLVAWEDYVPSVLPVSDLPPSQILIRAARITPSLMVLDPEPMLLSDTHADIGPLVASDGNSFLVAWSHLSYPDGDSVFAQRISSAGSLLAHANGVRLNAGRVKSVAWDGLQFAVALSVTHLTSTLYLTHVAALGSIESITPLTVVNDRADPAAALIVIGPGRVNVVYTRVGSEPEYGDVERVFVATPHLPRGRAVGR